MLTAWSMMVELHVTVTASRSIKSAERTLALFELFSREQRPFTVSRVSLALSIPQPSASMLLRNLNELGYLQYDRSTRTYAPSIRVALLGTWIDRRFSEAGAIGARLDKLQRSVGETAYLGIQNQAQAQYVLSQHPEDPDRLVIVSGQLRSLTCSSVGRSLLALKPDSEVLSWARRSNAEATEERFKVRLGDLLKLIRQVREDGFATTEGDVTPGLGSFAMSFVAPMGDMPMAVAVGGPIARIKRKRRAILSALHQFKSAFNKPVASSKS